MLLINRATDKPKPLVKSIYETVPKSLFWAPAWLSGYKYAP